MVVRWKVTTTIGYGSPNKTNSYSVHGASLGEKEVEATRNNLGWLIDFRYCKTKDYELSRDQ
ncbi:hypothetical protein F2Q69_00049589 [Brassica cretica]|uniref:Transketolase N-terminal domain-containing protein n=1 Tax=Brassica cretica TaxID=69181 RepID=A0A8S9PFN1_BRACR|nr:hypothetical protein F2Q69_00049589 [Brassica cretica]